ncbi:MAG: hypothetical protein LC620_08355 [Halobacteriales archaeon]|nr:hypothetical protein [Halobacteriales archaeon]
MEYLLAFGEGVNKNGEALGWKSRMTSLEQRLRADDSLGPMRRATIDTTMSYLRDSGVYEAFSWKKPAQAFGRHPILHGHSLAFATQANAIRALLALDALYWTTGFQFREKKLEFVDPTPSVPFTKPADGERWVFD